MDRRSNMQTLWMHKSISQIKKLTSFNKYVAISYSMPFLSITLLSLTSEKFPQINLRPQITQKNRWPSSLIMSLVIHRRKFSTGQVGCNQPYILTRHTFHSLRPEVGPVGSIFLAKVHLKPNNPEYLVPTVNGILLVLCKIMRNIMASASEAKYGTMVVNSQTDAPFNTT